MSKITWDAAPKTGNPEVDQFLHDLLEIAKTQQKKGSGIADMAGSGSPEGVITANIGTTYARTDGGVGSTLYYKSSGTGNTGWTAVP